MTENAIPSKDPANDGTLAGAFNSIFKKLMQSVDKQLPAIVLAYDRVNNVATVQPLVPILTTEGEAISRAQIAKVPVLALGGGSFVVNFNLQAGDKGWLEASDRDISLFMQGMAEAPPNTFRLHSFEDARFIPDVFREWDVGDLADDEMTIQSLDGTVRMTLSPTTIKIRAPEHIIIETTDEASKMDITPAGITATTSLFKVVGNLEVTGTSLLTGHVDAPAGAEISSVEYISHKHTGVQTGGGTSGPVTP